MTRGSFSLKQYTSYLKIRHYYHTGIFNLNSIFIVFDDKKKLVTLRLLHNGPKLYSSIDPV